MASGFSRKIDGGGPNFRLKAEATRRWTSRTLKAGPYTAPGTSSPTARINASALLRVTGPGRIR